LIHVKANVGVFSQYKIMVRTFATAALTSNEIGPAFTLISVASPEIDLAAWKNYVRPLIDGPALQSAGAITLRNEGRYLCGLLTYHSDRDLRFGTVLTVDVFRAIDVVNEAAATRALLEAAEEKARELRCAAICIRLDRSQSSLSRGFTAAGHQPQGQIFCKPIAPKPALI
jgi:hypothetical protein